MPLTVLTETPPKVSIVSGLVGGFVATLVMSAFMMTLGDDSPPPTALFWSQYVADGPPEEYVMQGMVLHLLYGTVAGGVLVAVAPLLGFVTLDGLTSALLWALVYGFVLFVGAAVFWMNVVLDVDAGPKEVGMFLFFHLVYGAVLGVWLGLGILG